MKPLFSCLIPTLLISNIAWAEPVKHTTINSISEAMIQITARTAKPQEHSMVFRPYTHESEKNNSLSRAALAIQEKNVKVERNIEINDSHTNSSNIRTNSLFDAVLVKQASHFK